MSSYQLPEDQASFVVPTVEITDYDFVDPDLEDYGNTTSPIQTYLASSSKKSSGKRRSKDTAHSGSDTERDTPDMSTRSSKQPSGSKRHSGSSKSKSKSKTDDWTDVTEPEERRRIQNRIAQRKFRMSIPDQQVDLGCRTDRQPQERRRENRKNKHRGTNKTKRTPSTPTESPSQTT